jgi:hypothetical protein
MIEDWLAIVIAPMIEEFRRIEGQANEIRQQGDHSVLVTQQKRRACTLEVGERLKPCSDLLPVN